MIRAFKLLNSKRLNNAPLNSKLRASNIISTVRRKVINMLVLSSLKVSKPRSNKHGHRKRMTVKAARLLAYLFKDNMGNKPPAAQLRFRSSGLFLRPQ